MPSTRMNSSNKTLVRGVSKRYGDTDVLVDITIEIKPREFVSIIGQNASGKSTLLKIIAGVIPATSGSVNVEGEISYMPQDHALLPWRTVEENLYLPTDVRGDSRDSVRGRMHGLLGEFGLEQYAHAYPSTLSGGTRQKIALLRTALQEHPLLLLDEPFAALDAITRLEMQSWLQTLVQKINASTLLITHDIREAIFFSDTIYVLAAGGTMKERIPVPLPRPRTHTLLTTPEALALEENLRKLLVHTV